MTDPKSASVERAERWWFTVGHPKTDPPGYHEGSHAIVASLAAEFDEVRAGAYEACAKLCDAQAAIWERGGSSPAVKASAVAWRRAAEEIRAIAAPTPEKE
jgi:hypothetical protein